MKMISPSRRWIVPALLLVAVMGLPVGGFMSSSALNYYANFDDSAAQGPGAKSWSAYGGAVNASGPAGIFGVVFVAPGDGEVELRANASPVDADLAFELDEPVMSSFCDVSFSLSAAGDFGDFDIRFDDVGDIGILDLQFTEQRTLRVEGQEIGLPLASDEFDLHVSVQLESSAVGVQLWSVTLVGPTSSVSAYGTLTSPTISLHTLHFIRRAGSDGATWRLDDVLVTSNDPAWPNFIPTGAYRQK